MGRLSDTYIDHLLDMAFAKEANSFPASTWIGLSTTTPENDGTNVTEPVGNNYARVEKVNNLTNWPLASGRSKSNGTDIVFPTASGAWGTITHFVIYSAVTSGDFIAWGALTVPVSVINGATVTFVTGSLVITAPGA